MPGTPTDTMAEISGLAASDSKTSLSSDKVAEIAIQDIVRYQEQLLKLIFFHDEKGHKVLSIYVTVIAATVTAGFGLNQLGKLTIFIELFLGAAIVSLLAGCVFAYLTAWTTPIFLPARKPDFWMWALENEQTVRETTWAYLTQSEAIIQSNAAISNRSSERLQNAYICGLAAPVVGAAIVWLAYWGKP